MKIEVGIKNKDGIILVYKVADNDLDLYYKEVYEEGDTIQISFEETNQYFEIQLDEAMGSNIVFITQKDFKYVIPFGENKLAYSPKAFSGSAHYIKVRKLLKEELQTYRNLALNPYDQDSDCGVYPHAKANVHTRNEAVFAPRCVIDGIIANLSHGPWPYQSWGINQRDDAYISIEFGRKVVTDRIRLFTRCDFPHDNWWEKVTLCFSDGSSMECELDKSSKAHEICFNQKEVEWVRLENLVKAEDPSPFPALSQFEVFGYEKL